MRFFLKRILCFSLMFCTLPWVFSVGAVSVPPEVSARAAILYCAETGETLFEKSADEKLSMASTTKIMTALLAMEYCRANGDIPVKISEAQAAVEGSSMGLEAGDELYLSQLCVGMLLASGNDAAEAAADAVSDDFASLMNHKADEIGMDSTNFVTASGLDADAHYSTASDMALLSAAALEDEWFVSVVSSKFIDVSVNMGEKTLHLENHNKLLWSLDDCIGVKTGYTRKSGRCLVSAVRRYGVTLICVTLNAPDDWNDHMSLYSYADDLPRFTYNGEHSFVLPTTEHPVICSLESADPICCFSSDEIKRKIFLPKFIYSHSYSKGDVVGRAEYSSGGKIIATRNIIID